MGHCTGASINATIGRHGTSWRHSQLLLHLGTKHTLLLVMLQQWLRILMLLRLTLLHERLLHSEPQDVLFCL
jgi:hypothetical protein